jgi:hypothetical protein
MDEPLPNTTLSTVATLFREEAERARRYAAAMTDKTIIERLNEIAALYDEFAGRARPWTYRSRLMVLRNIAGARTASIQILAHVRNWHRDRRRATRSFGGSDATNSTRTTTSSGERYTPSLRFVETDSTQTAQGRAKGLR